MATYGYARVSTRPQTEGDSLEVQARMIRGRCAQDGQELDHLYVERGVSGARPLDDRPEGRGLIAALKPGDTVIASKLDRMFRSASDALDILERLKSQRVHLVLLDLGGDVTGAGVASLIFSILAAVAQFERERIADRVREMKEHQKQSGRYRGGKPPFGFVVNEHGMLEPLAEQQGALALIVKRAAKGDSLRRIQAALLDTFDIRLSHVAVGRIVAEAKIRRLGSAGAAA